VYNKPFFVLGVVKSIFYSQISKNVSDRELFERQASVIRLRRTRKIANEFREFKLPWQVFEYRVLLLYELRSKRIKVDRVLLCFHVFVSIFLQTLLNKITSHDIFIPILQLPLQVY
jgi:hypothetical protein